MTPRFFRGALLLLLFAASLQAADVIAAVRRADDERVAATLAGDVKALAAIYSDEMYYAHSSGKLDTKASQLAGIADGTYKYTRFDYQDRTFNPVAPGIVLMKGKAIVGLTRRSGEKSSSISTIWGFGDSSRASGDSWPGRPRGTHPRPSFPSPNISRSGRSTET